MHRLNLKSKMVLVISLSAAAFGCSATPTGAAALQTADNLQPEAIWSMIAPNLGSPSFEHAVSVTNAGSLTSLYGYFGGAKAPQPAGVSSVGSLLAAEGIDSASMSELQVGTAVAVMKKAQTSPDLLTWSDTATFTHLLVYLRHRSSGSLALDTAAQGLTPTAADGKQLPSKGETGSTMNSEINQRAWCDVHPNATNCEDTEILFDQQTKQLDSADRKTTNDAVTKVLVCLVDSAQHC